MKKRKIALVLATAIGILAAGQVKSSAAVYNGWEQSGGNWYYYNSGSMCTGWVKDGGNWYYLNGDGSMRTGWIKYEGAWYYINPNGSMATGWINDRGTWYYMNPDGKMRTGILVQGSREYYLDADGAMKIGWFKRYDEPLDREAWYYAESDGNLRKGWLYYNNLWYYLSEDGSLASNINAKGYYINRDGVWDKSGDDKVILATAKESYDVNEKNLVVKFINNTNNTVKYSNDFSVERYENGQWIKIANTGTNDKEDTESAPNSVKITISDFSGFRDKMKAGKYRFGTKVNNEYVYAEFELTGIVDEGKVEINAEKQNYYLNETKEIKYTITNNTYGKISYNSDYIIQKDIGGKYVDMKLKNNNSENKTYELKEGEKASYAIPLSNIDEKLMPGHYRIAKKINDTYVYESFDFANDNIAEMTTDKYAYFNKSDKIKITITNESDKNLSYGKAYRVQKWEYNKGWLEVPLKDNSFTEESVLLKPQEKDTQIISIENINEDEMFGDYRIVKEIDGNEIYSVFSYGYAMQNN